VIIHKKTSSEPDRSWCLILSPVKGELAKSQTTDKLSHFFSISEDESAQLVESAPVILLEDMPYETAQKAKHYLDESGVEIVLTNNSLQKRKCFKTVWPEEPRLNFVALESSHFDPQISCKEYVPQEQPPQPRREERPKAGDSVLKSIGFDDQGEYQKKYEILLHQYNLLVEEKLIQEQKADAIEKEVRFLRDKDNAASGHLKTLAADKENLMHELEAHRVKHELVAKQLEAEQASQTQKFAALESENKTLNDRLQMLQKEYEEAEMLWSRKLKAKEDEVSGYESQTEAFRRKTEELALRLEQAEKNYQRALAEETMGLREKALRELVKRQEELEKEITEKEKALKNILAEQEMFEKEIVRAKQLKSNGLSSGSEHLTAAGF